MRRLIALALLLVSATSLLSQEQDKSFTRQEDVVYGRKHGMALTLDVFTPKEKANGAALVWVVSGGWFSAHQAISPGFIDEFLKRGYTVFAVVHGSQPKFTIPEAADDLRRSVRFIRHNAERFKIDPARIGILGGSAGGHLSLMVGTTGDDGKADAADMVERASSRVQAVACYFPPTDFLNYGETGNVALGSGTLDGFRPPFDFNELSADTKRFERITDEKRRLEIGKQISPVSHVTKDDAPSLIIHGDADKLVPIQQAQVFVEKCEKAGVTAQLVTKPGAAHGWPTLLADNKLLADWFDKYLAKK